MKHPANNSIIIRMALLLTMVIAAALPLKAQEGLHVGQMFERYGHARGCKLVVLHDTKLRGYKLDLYKALTYKRGHADVEGYLKADRRAARKVREVVENGRIVSGYYMMPPERKGINRYVLFSDVPGKPGAVIYIEGRLSPDDIMKIIYTR